jgi:phosphatidate phosphatase APP1
VRFVLVGDDGERDPEIYDWVRRRHPQRVEAIWIRRVHPDPRRARFAGQRDLGDVMREVLRETSAMTAP